MPSGLDAMMDLDKLDDLARMYRLFTLVPAGLPCIKQSLKDSINRRGREINQASLSYDGVDETSGDKESKAKTKLSAGKKSVGQILTLALKWVQDVLDLKDKFETVWQNAFAKDRELESAINEVSLPADNTLRS